MIVERENHLDDVPGRRSEISRQTERAALQRFLVDLVRLSIVAVVVVQPFLIDTIYVRIEDNQIREEAEAEAEAETESEPTHGREMRK